MISLVLQDLNNRINPIFRFHIHVCSNGHIFLDEIENQINKDKGVFVLIPIRLGIENIDNKYHVQIKRLFFIQQNVGIAGGKDQEALYLCGIEDINDSSTGYFHLDPHFIQKAIPSKDIE